MFLMIYELLQKHSDKAKVVRLKNEWVEVDPASWRTKTDFTVRVGLGNGSREQNMVHLQTLAQMQEKVVAAGGMGLLVTPNNIYNTMKEIGMNMGLKNIEEFLTDPDDGQMQQQQDPNAGQAQVDAMKTQVDMQKLQLEAQKLELEKQKLEFEGQKLQAEIQMDQQENQLKAAELQMESYTDRPIKIG
jgi:DNA-binding transcriptional MerR regulator